jgi:hypothetical protein
LGIAIDEVSLYIMLNDQPAHVLPLLNDLASPKVTANALDRFVTL